MPTSTKRSSPSRPRDTARARGGRGSAVFVDSSAWIAFFSASDGRHADAETGMRRARTERVSLLTTSLVVAEVHRLLLFRAGARAARAVLERLSTAQDLDILHLSKTHHDAARGWLDRFPDRKVTYTDAMSFAAVQTLRCQFVFTFDADFEVAGFKLWQTEPR